MNAPKGLPSLSVRAKNRLFCSERLKTTPCSSSQETSGIHTKSRYGWLFLVFFVYWLGTPFVAQEKKKGKDTDYTLNVEVNFVLLHVSVFDEKEFGEGAPKNRL
ncbi:MAG: hypothetical protein U0V70_16410 [Terriglobia bacterium]